MTLIFKFAEALTFDDEDKEESAKELRSVIEKEAANHFENKEWFINGLWTLKEGYIVEFEISDKVFIDDLENAKRKMYDEHKGYMEDFISDVQEYCSYGGIVVTAKEYKIWN